MLIFEVRLHLIKPKIKPTLTETREITSRNMKLKKGLNVPKSSKNTNYFGCTFSFCFRIIASKMLFFEICLPLKEPFVVPVGETRAYTSRKFVVVQGSNLTKSSKKHKLLWLHSCFFALE